MVPVLCLVILSWMAFSMQGLLSGSEANPEGMSEWFSKALTAAFTVVGFFLAFRLTVSLVIDEFLAKALGRPIPKIMKDMIAIAFGFIALLFCVQILLNDAFSGFLALSGIFGIVIGLALRPIILDIFSGLSTNMEAAFQIDDWITVEGNNLDYTGWVDQVNWRTTHIRTRSGNLIVCPNSFLSTSIVTNHSRPFALSRYEIKVKLPPEIATGRALRILDNAVRATLDERGGPSREKSPDVLITEVSDSGVDYWIRFWVNPASNSYDTAIHKVNQSVMRHLRLAGIRLATVREHVYFSRPPNLAADYDNLEDRVSLLSALEIFQGVNETSLKDLAGKLQIRRFSGGEEYFREGDDSREMYILVEGNLHVTMEESGKRVYLNALQPGDYFGEMALMTDEPRSATITSISESTAFEIGRKEMSSILKDQPGLLEVLSRNLAARKLENDKSLREFAEDLEEATPETLAGYFLGKMRSLFKFTRRPFEEPEKTESSGKS